MTPAPVSVEGHLTLSVLTQNLWHDMGPWTERAKLLREWVAGLNPDLIGFQEVLCGAGRDLAADLLGDAGYHLAFAPAMRFWNDQRLEFGNSVASRWPILDREALPLPHGEDGERRSALCVIVEAPVGPVCFTCTHLNWRFQHGEIRERQVVAVADLVLRRRPKEGFPPILVGDFNAEPDSSEIRFLTGLGTLGGRSVYFHDSWRVAGARRAELEAGFTWSNRNPYARANLEPDRRIDYIFTGFPKRDGVGLLETCRVVCDGPRDGVWPSDHFGLYAELRTTPL
jgi:endonuclease/exonuclease/phosphatase family metal-dependent hydrolase